MSLPPPLSVVCCVKNGQRYLPAFGDCLRAAWRTDFELVLLDDASTDDTPSIFDDWESEFPHVVRLRSEQSGGLGRAQLQAVGAATGEYLWIIDCDDRFPADAPQRLLAAAERTGADVVVAKAESTDGTSGDHYLIDARSAPESINGTTALERMLVGDIEGYTWTKLFRRSLFDDSADLPTPSTQCDFVRSALAFSRSESVAVVDEVVYTYVRHGASLMDRKDPPLENLVVAHDHLLSLVRRGVPAGIARRRLTAAFTTWFLAASAVKIPVYVHAGPDSLAAGRRIARRAMRAVRPLDAFHIDRTVGAQALLLRLSPRLFEQMFRARVGRGATG